MSVPDIAQHTRRSISPYTMSLPGIAQRARREIHLGWSSEVIPRASERLVAPYSRSVPRIA
eukprot:3270052-Rhodomonas_salina.1